jgi:hypothetical protein
MKKQNVYEAGVWEQGRDLVAWSTHKTAEAAEKAAYRYMRKLQRHGPATGGYLSWAGGWRHVGGQTHWISHE